LIHLVENPDESSNPARQQEGKGVKRRCFRIDQIGEEGKGEKNHQNPVEGYMENTPGVPDLLHCLLRNQSGKYKDAGDINDGGY